jgi:hypothetical protein
MSVVTPCRVNTIQPLQIRTDANAANDPATTGLETLEFACIAHFPAKLGSLLAKILQMLRKSHCEDAAIC